VSETPDHAERDREATTPSRADVDAAPEQPPDDAGTRPRHPVLRSMARGLLALLILAGGIFAAFWFNWTEGTARQGEEAEESARVVEVIEASQRTQPVTVRGMGTVEAAREVTLTPRVSGRIVKQHEAFVPGGHFESGQLMIQIDRTDYQHTVQQRESELEQAQASLKLEKANQSVAREELSLLQGQIENANRNLILRQPQLKQARAALQSARAALEQAREDLSRTRIEAPFDGQLVSRSVTAGDNVSQGQALGTFVGSDHYWVRVAIPVSHLRWVSVSEEAEGQGSPATIRHESAWGAEALRKGRVRRVVGRLEDNSRMAQVIVRLDDPLARETDQPRPRLLLGQYVSVHLEGRQIEQAVALDRDYLRQDEVVWVMNENDRLELREVEVAFRGKERAYIRTGLDDGDRIVTTNLASPVEGMLLQTVDQTRPAEGSPGDEAEQDDD